MRPKLCSCRAMCYSLAYPHATPPSYFHVCIHIHALYHAVRLKLVVAATTIRIIIDYIIMVYFV